MSAQQAYLTLAPVSGSTFSNDQVDDVLLFTSSSNQSIHIGTKTGSNAMPTMSFTYSGGSNIVSVQGNLSVTNNFITSNLITNNFVTSNITVTGQIVQNGSNATQWISNGNTAYILGSNVAIGKSNATNALEVVGTGSFSSNLFVGNTISTSNITSSNETIINSTITTLINNTFTSSNIVASNIVASNVVINRLTTFDANISNLTASNLTASNVVSTSNIITPLIQTGQTTTTNTTLTAANNQTPANGNYILWSTGLPGFTTVNTTVGSVTAIFRYIATRPSTITITPTAWFTSRQGVNDNVQFIIQVSDPLNNILNTYSGNQFTATTFTITTGMSWTMIKNESTSYNIFSGSTLSVSEVQSTPVSFNSMVTIPIALITNTSASNITASNISALTVAASTLRGTVTLTDTLVNNNIFTSNISASVGASICNVVASNITTSNLTTTGNLTIGGNLTVNGTTTTVNTQTLSVADNIIQINSTLSNSAPPSTLLSGIEVVRGTQTNYQFLFQESNQLFKIGQIGSLQAVATRPDTVANASIGFWDMNSTQISFNSNFTFSNSTVTVSNISVSNLSTPLATITTLTSTTGTIGSIVNSSLNTSNVTVNTNLTAPLSTITTLSNNSLSTSNVTVGTNLTTPSANITSLFVNTSLTTPLATVTTLTSTTGTIGTIVNNSINASNVTVNTNLTAPTATITTISSSNMNTSNLSVTNAITTSNINFTGSLLQNGSPYIGSQWTTGGSGSNIYITGSNVGIGNSNPGFPLDVGGSAAFSGTTNTRIFINRATSNDINSVIFSRGGAATANGEAEIGLAGDTSLRFRVNSTLGSYTTQFSILSNGNVVVNSNLTAPLATITVLSNTTLSSVYGLFTTLSNSGLSSSNIVVGTNLTAPSGTITTFTSTTGTIGSIVNNSLNTSNVTVNTNLTTPSSTITTLTSTTGTIGSIVNNSLNTSNVTVNTNLTAPSGTITTLTSTTGTVGTIVNNSLNTSNITVNTNLTSPLATITTLSNITLSSVNGLISTLSNNNLSSSNVTVASTITATNINFTGSLLQSGSPYIGSQWITSNGGSNIYITGSNVGIGVNNPTTSLHVGCNAIINSNLTVGGTLSVNSLSVPNLTVGSNLTINSNLTVGGNLQLQNQVALKGLYLTRPNGTIANITLTQGFLQNSNGLFTTSNVGIGKSNPIVALDVVGSITATSNISASNINFTGSLLQNGSPYIRSQWTTNTSNVYISGSNVGIGTSILDSVFNVVNSNTSIKGITLTGPQYLSGGISFNSTEVGASNVNYFVGRGGTSTSTQNHLVIHSESANGPTSGVNFMTSGAVSRMFIQANTGFVGIGTVSPAYPLHVTSSAIGSNSTYTFYGATTGSGTFNFARSAVFSAAINAPEFQATSDLRVKSNINSVNDTSCFSKLNPVTFSYIDKVRYSDVIKYGFIAQEVEKVVPSAVSKMTDFISDIMTTAKVNNNSDILTFNEPQSISVNDKIQVVIPCQAVCNSTKNVDSIKEELEVVIVLDIIDDKRIRVNKTFSMDTNIFLIGKSVDDFRVLDSDQIVALTVSTLQALQKDHDRLKTFIATKYPDFT